MMGLYAVKLHVTLSITFLLIVFSNNSSSTTIPKTPKNLTENCIEDHSHCGDVKISYPFGVKESCSLGPDFMVTCDETSEPHRAILQRSNNLTVRNLWLGGELEILQPYVAQKCFDDDQSQSQVRLSSPVFSISSEKNELVAIGCDTNVTLEGFSRAQKRLITASLDSPCHRHRRRSSAEIPRGLGGNVTVSLVGGSIASHACSYGFVAELGFDDTKMRSSSGDSNGSFGDEKVPMVVEWSIGEEGCDVAEKLEGFSCLGNKSKCVDSPTGIGYVCQCLPGFQGNPYFPDGCQLCESDSTGSEACKNESPFPGKPKITTHHHKTEKSIEIGAAISASFLIITIVLVITLRTRQLKRKTTRETELKGLEVQTGFFIHAQIKTATNNFDPANKIGEGGFGPVYKGTLRDGTVIAVKQLSSRSRQGNREFVTEIGVVSGLKHPNLVRLYGCCIERNKLFLVYEYMENNSLARCLFGKEGLVLDWPTRKKICLGIAKGLAFLHEESVLKIVHRDIKTTNILLDEDFNAKIADFGLAKLDEEDHTHISTRITGTIGYMAPEYAQWGYLTFKADVYSFGVVALEIIAGKSNIKYQPNQNCICLVDWAIEKQQNGGDLLELVDPKLGSDFDEREIVLMVKIALMCVNHSPTLRPTMSEVVSMLGDDETSFAQKPIISDPHTNNAISDVKQRNPGEESQSLIRSSDYMISFSPSASVSSSSRDLYPVIIDANI